ncbi:MAG: selenocysteine-specific translation elongation factor [Gemmatimonadetes bacterium]|nr:selenocysteine-specific translation elongation factor [Gemmatimonadota bacterium]
MRASSAARPWETSSRASTSRLAACAAPDARARTAVPGSVPGLALSWRRCSSTTSRRPSIGRAPTSGSSRTSSRTTSGSGGRCPRSRCWSTWSATPRWPSPRPPPEARVRRLVLGTAGHIDHGKTALVRALTGVDTDRLQEEKERGITIDLGFAELTDGERRMGVVDVPGHEGFIRNMVAGATGMDVVLLVIAADEGVMPQTLEHLHIVTLLGVERLVVTLTKCDLVDPEWLEMVREEVVRLLADGPYAGAPVLPTSARTGQGLPELTRTLLAAAEEGAEREAGDRARLPIDRVFTVHGTGTVVTGTLRSGRLVVGERVSVLPGDIVARVRGLQVHGRDVEQASAGERTAVALTGAGLERQDLDRGQALVAGPGWAGASMLTARVRVLPDTGWQIEGGQRLRLHLGTAEVMARCAVLQGYAIAPGEIGWVQLRLESPVAARARDAFVLRSFSPMTTIAGGRVAEVSPPRRGRISEAEAAALERLLDGDPEEAVGAALELAGPPGIAVTDLAVRTGLAPAPIELALAGLLAGGARVSAGRALAASEVARARAALERAVDAHHEHEPLRPGLPAETLRAGLAHGAPPDLADDLLQELVRAGALQVRAGVVSRPGFVATLTGDQKATRDALIAVYRGGALSAPWVEELPEALRGRADLWPLLRLLEAEGELTSVDHGLFMAKAAVDAAAGEVTLKLGGRKNLGPKDFREIIPVTRKHLMPLLSHFDNRGVTVRRGEGREVPHPSGTKSAEPRASEDSDY